MCKLTPALFQTLMQLGGALGLALTSVLATAEREKALAKGKEYIDALLKGLQASFWLSAALNFAAFALACVILRGLGIVGGHGKGGKPGGAGGPGGHGNSGTGGPPQGPPPGPKADAATDEKEMTSRNKEDV